MHEETNNQPDTPQQPSAGQLKTKDKCLVEAVHSNEGGDLNGNAGDSLQKHNSDCKHAQDHAHNHATDHDHSHFHFGHHHDHGNLVPDNITRSFIIGIILNSIMVIAGLGAGYWFHSLALLSDAGHNLGDVASLLMALAAIRIAKVKSTEKFTYGYKKTTILTSLINGIVLLLITVCIIYAAINRLQHPAVEVKGIVISLVAFLGILINSASAWLFIKDKENDLNVKSAYMHLAADALVSAGVMVAGIVMFFTHWFWLDSVISILISVIILAGTWSILIKSLFLTLDGVPSGIDIEKIKDKLAAIPGIQDAHHVHVWALSTTENALTAHLVMDAALTLTHAELLKTNARVELLQLNIQHVTLEVESSDKKCINGDC